MFHLLLGCLEKDLSRPPAPPTPTEPTLDSTAPPGACEPGHAVLHTPDPIAAERGVVLIQQGMGGPLIPRVGLRNLWVVWGGLPRTEAQVQVELRERYGLVEAPWDNDGYPLGLHTVDDVWATTDCLLCHADTAGGQVVLGVGNSRLDLQALFDDLVALGEVGEQLGLPPFPLPYTLQDATGAAGSVDAFGLAMQLSTALVPGVPVETSYGYQQAAPWWTLSVRDRLYSDGSGDAANHRTMAATLLGAGITPQGLQTLDDDLLGIQAWMWSLTPPRYPFELDEDEVTEGRAVYAEARCATCHGDPCAPSSPFPDRVVPAGEVGTDPVRAAAFGDVEAAWVNASWFGAPAPMVATGGYLAGPLLGVWASAPYLHNGTIPDLWGVLDSTSRPPVWRRTGFAAADYDQSRGGWRVETPEAPADRSTPEARRIMDTAQRGLSAEGHPYGDSLDDESRASLVTFLQSL